MPFPTPPPRRRGKLTPEAIRTINERRDLTPPEIAALVYELHGIKMSPALCYRVWREQANERRKEEPAVPKLTREQRADIRARLDAKNLTANAVGAAAGIGNIRGIMAGGDSISQERLDRLNQVIDAAPGPEPEAGQIPEPQQQADPEPTAAPESNTQQIEARTSAPEPAVHS